MAEPSPKRRPWPRRIARATAAAAVTGLAIAIAVAAWLLWFFPNRLASTAATRVAKRYGVDLVVQGLALEPLHGVSFERLAVGEEGVGGEPLLSCGKVALRWEWREAVDDRRLRLTAIDVERPRIVLARRDGRWNVERLLDRVMDALGVATAGDGTESPDVPPATPAPTPSAVPIHERLETQVRDLETMLAGLPVEVALDRVTVRDVGIVVETETGTLASIEGGAFEGSLSLPRGGGGRLVVEAMPDPPLRLSAAPAPGIAFAGTLRPEARVESFLPRETSFTTRTTLHDATLSIAGLMLPVDFEVEGSGSASLPAGDLSVELSKVSWAGFFDAVASFSADDLGVGGLEATWKTAVRGDRLPPALGRELRKAAPAAKLSPGGTIDGSLTGRLATIEPDRLRADLARGRLPLSLEVSSRGVTDDRPISTDVVQVGRIVHRAFVSVSPERVRLKADASIERLRAPDLLGSATVPLRVAGDVEVRSDLDAARIHAASAEVTPIGLRIDGSGRVAGLNAALAQYQASAAKGADALRAGMAAVTDLDDIRLTGSLRLAPRDEREILAGVHARGALEVEGTLTRGRGPHGRVRGTLAADGFGARMEGIAVEGVDARLAIDRELILGGRPLLSGIDVASDDAVVFDPATRGYFARLSSLAATADNVRVARAAAGKIEVTDLSAAVRYDGSAIHVDAARMHLLGGEVVSRLILRPTAKGLHVAAAGDLAGIDLQPLLLEKPVADPDETRVHVAAAAGLFLSATDPLGSLSQMRMRADAIASGKRVLEMGLAFLDPEFKDPVYNWARDINKRIGGLTRPEITLLADRGMYDVEIRFPSMGISKEVRRIPLEPLLRLKFTERTLASLTPSAALLPLLAARGIDADGAPLLPPIAEADE